MAGILKLLIPAVINLAGLGYLICWLIKRGNTYRQALWVAWNMIIFDIHENVQDVKGAALIRKTWWLMILIYYLYWIVYGGYGFILFFFLLHTYWFLQAVFSPSRIKENILFLRDNWGIIQKEIGADSWFAQKSLSELDLRKKNLLVLAIERDGQILSFPKGLEKLIPGDRILLFGEMNNYKFYN